MPNEVTATTTVVPVWKIGPPVSPKQVPPWWTVPLLLENLADVPLPFGAAAPGGGRPQRAQARAGHAQRRAGGADPAGAQAGGHRPALAAAAPARSAGAPLLRGSVGGTDRQRHGDQPRGSQESYGPGHRVLAGRAGDGDIAPLARPKGGIQSLGRGVLSEWLLDLPRPGWGAVVSESRHARGPR